MTPNRPPRISRRGAISLAVGATAAVVVGYRALTAGPAGPPTPTATPAAEATVAAQAAAMARLGTPAAGQAPPAAAAGTAPAGGAAPPGAPSTSTVGQEAPVPTPTATLVPPKPTVTPTPRPPTPTPIPIGVPQALEIPKIGVAAPIAALGTDPNGQLTAPSGPEIVGWFVGGPKPGEPGNALLTGHLDWRTGQTAVFWRLRELEPGDRIYVRTSQERLEFLVEATKLYDRDKAPVNEILGWQIGRVITLITCEGQFIPAERDYTQRRIVRARVAA